MSQIEQDENEEDGSEGDQESGSGSLGSPKLKPNLEQLMDPEAAAAADAGGEGRLSSDGQHSEDTFGDWRYQKEQLMLFNNKLRKKLMLAEMDSPNKLLKVIIGLGTQQGWDTENFVKALDYAAQQRFNKPLYQVISPAKDSLMLDWKSGTLSIPSTQSPPPRGPGAHSGGI